MTEGALSASLDQLQVQVHGEQQASKAAAAQAFFSEGIQVLVPPSNLQGIASISLLSIGSAGSGKGDNSSGSAGGAGVASPPAS